MILSKYKEIMEHITVDEEMKSRIIRNINSSDLSKSKIIRFPNIKRYIAYAACLAIILIGTIFATKLINKPQIEPEPVETGGVDTVWDTKEYKNAESLSAASGIKIEDLNNIPFNVTEAVYRDYKNNLAEIVYSDESQNLYYRVSKGNADNSGDYNEYGKVYTKSINGVTVTLKGNGELVFLALYEKDGYSYSIGASNGLTQQQLEKMI